MGAYVKINNSHYNEYTRRSRQGSESKSAKEFKISKMLLVNIEHVQLSQKKSFQNQINLIFYQLDRETLLLVTKMVIIYELEYDRIGQIYTEFFCVSRPL